MGASIVLADDEPDLRTVYASCLRNSGYVVWEASDGIEALTLCIERRPDLMILDVWMPNMNGFEVLDRLREDARSSNLKVVMLSSLGDSDTRLEGFSAGVVDYWVKGLSLVELRRRVDGLLVAAEFSSPLGVSSRRGG